MLKTKFPAAYGPNMTFKSPPETISNERAKAGSKATARYPSAPLTPSQANGTAGKAKVRALTPGTSPAGS